MASMLCAHCIHGILVGPLAYMARKNSVQRHQEEERGEMGVRGERTKQEVPHMDGDVPNNGEGCSSSRRCRNGAERKENMLEFCRLSVALAGVGFRQCREQTEGDDRGGESLPTIATELKNTFSDVGDVKVLPENFFDNMAERVLFSPPPCFESQFCWDDVEAEVDDSLRSYSI